MFSMGHYERRGAGLHPRPRALRPAGAGRVGRLVLRLARRFRRGQGAREAWARPEALALRGRIAVANSKVVYQRFREMFYGAPFAALRARGCRVQRPLWASTSTKNPAYRDVLYVEELIGPDTVNTMPPETIEAFRDHGRARTRRGRGRGGRARRAAPTARRRRRPRRDHRQAPGGRRRHRSARSYDDADRGARREAAGPPLRASRHAGVLARRLRGVGDTAAGVEPGAAAVGHGSGPRTTRCGRPPSCPSSSTAWGG